MPGSWCARASGFRSGEESWGASSGGRCASAPTRWTSVLCYVGPSVTAALRDAQKCEIRPKSTWWAGQGAATGSTYRLGGATDGLVPRWAPEGSDPDAHRRDRPVACPAPRSACERPGACDGIVHRLIFVVPTMIRGQAPDGKEVR
ncbi:hypothetical protein GCM10010488_30420 [Oerskovia jenensis]